jgi:uncharacterized membrane protein
MEENKSVNVFNKIKALAIGFCGTGIFAQGIFSLKALPTYRMPRILTIVYDTFGHVGLAIAMILLGGALFFYGYSIWKKTGGKLFLFRLLIVLFMFIFAFIIFFATKTNSRIPTAEENKVAEESRLKSIDKMMQMDKPDFNDSKIDAYFAEYDALYSKYEINIKNKDQAGIQQSQTDEVAWVTKASSLMIPLSNEQKQQFALYIGKLSTKWQQLK